uniref:HTH cro/C1-type domain-containing protein n=1 Tax=Thermosporothrix sp. COM3 TaxID=2490863 RepID=A0A455SW17_9CHLR|nr:hypothetical protein KTC_64690 [Thermosporothrix sp. COM3]
MIRLRVREIAEARGFNQSTLSRASDVSFNTIKRIFQNPYRSVSTDTLDRLAKALGVDIRDLVESVPDDERR